MNFEIARSNMLEQQIRPWDVLDCKSLDIIEQIPREDFVPKQYKKVAFSDTELPLAHHQYMLEPKIEAKILQAIQVKTTDLILEIGTGSGYLTALLAHTAKNVHSIDIHNDLIETAKNTLTSLDIDNITFEHIDFNHLELNSKQYDAIVVGGSIENVPEKLKQALAMNGRLFVICGKNPLMLAKLYTRISSEQWIEEILFETEIPALENIKEKEEFVF